MNTPFNTGKVSIGSAYMPTKRPYHDQDALRLQDALLGNRKPIDASGVFIAAVCVIVMAIPIVHHWMR